MSEDVKDLYLGLLKRTLTRYDLGDELYPVAGGTPMKRRLAGLASTLLAPLNLELCRTNRFDKVARSEGRDWPAYAESMIGLKRLDNLHQCVVSILDDDVPGDVLEAGVWRGGASIFMRAALDVLGGQDRLVWLADSFEGLPAPDPDFAADADSKLHEAAALAVGIDTVKANFLKYDMLSDRVRFIKGWFSDTLKNAPVDRLALLRADGDMYSSTTDILSALYGKVSEGGFIVIDDYGAIAACRKAVDEFRSREGISTPLKSIDWTGVYWRKS
jgi:O-methyltransferase